MSWDNPSGQSFSSSHLSSISPPSLKSSPSQSLSSSTPSRIDHFASSLDMARVDGEVAWDAGCDFSWEAVKPRKTPRIVRHYLRNVRDIESGLPFTFPHVDDHRQKYRNISPTHNTYLLTLGYIQENSIFSRTLATLLLPPVHSFFPHTNF